MLFEISGIKQTQEKQLSVSFLIDAPDEASIRDFCGKNSVVIFTLAQYKGTKETFGKTVVKVSFGSNIYEIITPLEKVRDAYMFMRSAGLDVRYINSFDHMMADEDVATVIQKLEVEFTEQEKTKHTPKSHGGNIGNVVLQKDPELEKMKRIASQALSDIEEIFTKAGAGFGVRSLNDLKEVEEDLKKTKMGSNISKMRSLVSDAYKMMENLEMEYLDKQKAAEANLIQDSVVTHLDLVREYEKYEKAQKVKVGNLEKTPSDMYYIFFGKTGIYQRFLGKDLEKKFANRGEILYKSINYMVTFVFMCIVWLTITSLYQHYILQQQIFFFAFVDFALIGLILIVINKLKKPNGVQIIALFIIGTALYFTIRYLLISNFAL